MRVASVIDKCKFFLGRRRFELAAQSASSEQAFPASDRSACCEAVYNDGAKGYTVSHLVHAAILLYGIIYASSMGAKNLHAGLVYIIK